jgi:ArsR family transcriptional regulator, nickel/cobalt-responsive transcriptional repressor
MGHGIDETVAPDLADEAVVSMAQTLHALGTPSRLRILLRLRQGPCTVGDLAGAIEMEQSAVSHQLRVLRHLDLIVGIRGGKHISYRLYDGHVAQLLDEAIYHLEHLRLGVAGTNG